jgi:hypothetical protein
MTGRRRLLAVLVVSALAACGSAPRDEARQSLVKQLEDGGLDEKSAVCVVDAFFAGKTNEQLKGFFDRPQLTPDEAVEFAALGKRCSTQS